MRNVFTDSKSVIFCHQHGREARAEEVLRQTMHDANQSEDSRLMVENYIGWSKRRIANLMSHKDIHNLSPAAKQNIEKILNTFYGNGMRNHPNWGAIRRGAATQYCPFGDKGNNSREDVIKVCDLLERQL
jgi:hypothetical protein